MTVQNPPRKHHFIPVSYLDEWCSIRILKNKEERFILKHSVVNKNKIVSARKNPSQVGYKIDLYTVEGISISRKYEIEKILLQKIDRSGPEAIRNIIKNRIITPNLKRSVAEFMFSILQRNPARVSNFFKLYNMIDSIIQDFLKSNSSKKGYEHFNRNRNREEENAEFIKLFESIIKNDDMISKISEMEWDLVHSEHCELLTSDRPIVGGEGILHALNMNYKGFYFLFPINKEFFIMGTSDADARQTFLKCKEKLIFELNKNICKMCDESVYSHSSNNNDFIYRYIKKGETGNLGISEQKNHEFEEKMTKIISKFVMEEEGKNSPPLH